MVTKARLLSICLSAAAGSINMMISKTETNTQLDSQEQVVLFIYIQPRRCDISLWKRNVSRQEASRHVHSTSLSPFSFCLSSLAQISPTKHSPSFLSTQIRFTINQQSRASSWQRPSITCRTSHRQIWAMSLNTVYATYSKLFALFFSDSRSCGPKGTEAIDTDICWVSNTCGEQ